MSSWNDREHSKWIRWRMTAITCLLTLALCAVIGRVYYLQAVAQQDLLERQTTVEREITFKPRRGSILDRNGTELAVTVKAPSLHVRPRDIEDRAAAADKLAPLLEMDRDALFKKLDPKKSFVWLQRQVHPEKAAAVMALKIRGVGVTSEHKRFYPQQDLAGQILGFVGVDGNGLEGLERAFESQLAGDKTRIKGQRDARGRMILTEEAPKFETFEGATLELTIDERIQRVAQDALAEQVEKHKAKGGWAVAIDVQTGEILALANTPSFDPNRFREHTSKDWRLRPVTDTFEPGSVVKPLVLAAAMQEKTVSLDSRFDCEGGRIKIGRYSIRDSHAHDMLTAAEVVQVSSNICAYKMAQTIGKDKLYSYLKDFGFGSRTGLGLRGEQPGLVWPASKWAEVSFANIAFGQGFTATPVQITNSIAAIANDGMLMEPKLVRRVIDRDGQVIRESSPRLIRRIVNPEVARQAAQAMALVTMEGGTAKNAAMEHFTVAGKTGTAQKVNPKTRRYDPDMWIASFVGFLPAERPEIAIGVMIDEPHPIHYGGVVAAPAFTKIAREAIAVRGILPPPPEERFHADRIASESAKAPVKPVPQPENEDEDVMDLGVARVLHDPRSRRTDQGTVMPDLRGLTARQAILQARRLGVLPEVHGWGRVVSQRPEPGMFYQEGAEIELELLPASDSSLVASEPSNGPGSSK
jgi:cell division protein FtsI (penicillin-binding protein 3)